MGGLSPGGTTPPLNSSRSPPEVLASCCLGSNTWQAPGQGLEKGWTLSQAPPHRPPEQLWQAPPATWSLCTWQHLSPIEHVCGGQDLSAFLRLQSMNIQGWREVHSQAILLTSTSSCEFSSSHAVNNSHNTSRPQLLFSSILTQPLVCQPISNAVQWES